MYKYTVKVIYLTIPKQIIFSDGESTFQIPSLMTLEPRNYVKKEK